MAQTPDTDQPPVLDMSVLNQPCAWNCVATGYADVIAAHLAHYSADAIAMAKLTADDLVLDVATGPGTLSRQAARITTVHAIDFSQEMLQELRQRATLQELDRLHLQHADGQALPFEDDTFDAGFSMFGLFMFPDRAKGFAELARVIRPGGRAVVASWQPRETIPAFSIIGQEVAQIADIPITAGVQPLAHADVFKTEMSAAGFDVTVHAVTHTWQAPSLDHLWAELERSHVVLCQCAQQMPAPQYADLRRHIRAKLEEALGTGPQNIAMPAWMAFGQL